MQIQMNVSVQAAILLSWFSIQVQVLCDYCHTECDFDKRLVLDSAPKTLEVQLLRLQKSGSRDGASMEINERVTFNSQQYQLCGFVLHKGVTASAGHYTMVSVDCMDFESQKGNAAEAYILFYERSSSSQSDFEEVKDENELNHHVNTVEIPLHKEALIEVFNQPGDNGFNRLVTNVERKNVEDPPPKEASIEVLNKPVTGDIMSLYSIAW
ncbi:uncharacterized protein LOC113207102 isoform X2 [Frankliniella occidentalis]|uniref:Uncharacterized protein LOC113207102 isoform X2 n=1 Tax=Frankliniella occidentalis TaxID=133901 RepID=A0A9C6UC90_FRAOC|nr:uncharacterized protein LOC113207102 isoform X2 [Frankliniella occidentalis]